MKIVRHEREEAVSFEAVVRSTGGASMFDARPPARADVVPPAERVTAAAAELQRLGFRVRHAGTFSVSGEGPRSLWERVFQTRVARETHPALGTTYLTHVAGEPFRLPASLQPLVERAYPQRPPLYHDEPAEAPTVEVARPRARRAPHAATVRRAVSPLPPRVAYPHLRVPDDVALVLRATPLHEDGVTGRGVLVAMADTGFYAHPFYAWHGFHLRAVLAPDATSVEHDEYGHGTAEVANVFASARDADVVGVKMGDNPTLAWKTAVDLRPAVMTASWGYDLTGVDTLPNYLRPLEAAVVSAVRDDGIVVCFSAGNGQVSFPAMLPDVIAVGGVYATDPVGADDFALTASDYASSFDSLIYPGRHVPDVCGLVGLPPKAVYLMLPVEPGDTIDGELAVGAYPDGDGTLGADGWVAISGTSAAAPQVAGVCALVRQVRPDLSPAAVKALLCAGARDVTAGRSAMGDPARAGADGATGAGLVDAAATVRLAKAARQ